MTDPTFKMTHDGDHDLRHDEID
ncbi:MAG: hypothetical protein QOD67_4421, partial [Caballeronia sp.]|nr:hypothetical protein [Caballeronia sp.]